MRAIQPKCEVKSPAFLFQIIPEYTLDVGIVEPEALCRHPAAIRQLIAIGLFAVLIVIEFVI